MTLVPGGAGSMSAGFGAGGSAIIGDLFGGRDWVGPAARRAIVLSAAATVAATVILSPPNLVRTGVRTASARAAAWAAARKAGAKRIIRKADKISRKISPLSRIRGLLRTEKAGETIYGIASGDDYEEVWFNQDLFPSIVEGNMWLGPEVRFYVP